jgi:hypothetical protein
VLLQRGTSDGAPAENDVAALQHCLRIDKAEFH